MSESKYRVKKKKKFRKSFVFLFFFFIFLILVFLIYKATNNFEDFTKFFIKEEEKEIISEKERSLLDIFIERLPSQNLNYASSSVEEDGDEKIFLDGTRENSGYIYVNSKDKGEFVWITFVSAISALPLKEKIEKDLKNLEYIDLRFGNKIFYKWRSGEVDLTSNTEIDESN